MRSAEQFHAAKRLTPAGMNDCAIAREIGVPRTTVRDWRRRRAIRSRNRHVWRLRITLDKKYPAIIDRCRRAIEVLMPDQCAGLVQRAGCADVSLHSKHWPCLLPQHGPGKKHTRTIALEPWQQVLVDKATEEFVLGLIHSDGCRVVANDRGVMSIRYHFSNRSEDIIGLFTAALDAPLIFLGRGLPSTSSRSTAKPPPPDWTNSSGRRTARYR
jgi:hypothetical protein